MKTNKFIATVRDYYSSNDFVPLHAPQFLGNEKSYINNVIDSTFVSSVGPFVGRFEKNIQEYTNSKLAVVTTTGTSALHIALISSGVQRGDYVITQALTFVATANAIMQAGAEPIFVDVDNQSFGLCPIALEQFLNNFAIYDDNRHEAYYKTDHRRIRAALPMHTFGHPADLDNLLDVCDRWGLLLIEDAAESLGSFYKDKHTGLIGKCGALSFNGNKIITTVVVAQ